MFTRLAMPVARIGRQRIDTRCIRNASTGPSYQSPNSSERMTSHRAFYKQFGLPMVKVFLGALFTYQVTYFLWLKLESLENKKEGDAEIARLEQQLEDVKKVK